MTNQKVLSLVLNIILNHTVCSCGYSHSQAQEIAAMFTRPNTFRFSLNNAVGLFVGFVEEAESLLESGELVVTEV